MKFNKAMNFKTQFKMNKGFQKLDESCAVSPGLRNVKKSFTQHHLIYKHLEMISTVNNKKDIFAAADNA
jgi:hypothetical protein